MLVVVAAMGAPIVVLAMESSDALFPFIVAAGIVVLPFLLFVSGCSSGGCIDVPLLLLLFVDVVGFVSAGVDGNALMLFVSVVSVCGGGGCINVSSTLVFINVGGCNSAGFEAVPIVVAAMGPPVIVLAMELQLHAIALRCRDALRLRGNGGARCRLNNWGARHHFGNGATLALSGLCNARQQRAAAHSFCHIFAP